MAHLDITDDGDVRIVSLNRPKANALNSALVDALVAAFDEASTDTDVRAVLLTSALDGFFSVGFDVREVFDYDRARMGAYWEQFIDLYETVFAFPKPVIGALTGHTFAGGILLAFACDLRLMAQGDFGLGVSGINLGIALPEGAMNMAVNAVGIGHARHLFLTGETIDPERAWRIGLVNELVPPDELRPRALERAHELADKSPSAFRSVHDTFDRLSGRPELGSDRDDIEIFLDDWFSPDAEYYRERVRSSVTRDR